MGNSGNTGKEVDSIGIQKRVYKVSLLLRRKPISAVIQFITLEWGVSERQAYNYVKLAREEWQKYFDHLKYSGMGYYVAQLRDLKDQAYNSKKVVIGKEVGEDGKEKRKVVKIPNLGLVFEITKEEAKLMGSYPAEKHIDIITDFASWIKHTKAVKNKGQGKKQDANEKSGDTGFEES